MELGIALIRKACVLIKESSRCDLVDSKKKKKKLWSEDRTLGYFFYEDVHTCRIQLRKAQIQGGRYVTFQISALLLHKKFKYIKICSFI